MYPTKPENEAFNIKKKKKKKIHVVPKLYRPYQNTITKRNFGMQFYIKSTSNMRNSYICKYVWNAFKRTKFYSFSVVCACVTCAYPTLTHHNELLCQSG
jgi:hypothetical protein